MGEDMIDLSDLKYRIERKWRDFAWTMWRRDMHRARIYKRFKKINFYSFDAVDSLYEVCFALFAEYYEKGGIESIDWVGSGPEHVKAKKIMDSLYNYYIFEKQNKEKAKLDNDLEDEEKRMLIYLGVDYSGLRDWEIGARVEKERQKKLEKLIKFRDYYWT